LKIRQEGSLSPTDRKKYGRRKFLGGFFIVCAFPADIGHPSVEMAFVDHITLDFSGDVEERVMKNLFGSFPIGDDSANHRKERSRVGIIQILGGYSVFCLQSGNDLFLLQNNVVDIRVLVFQK
jgi:hypothetical protein